MLQVWPNFSFWERWRKGKCILVCSMCKRNGMWFICSVVQYMNCDALGTIQKCDSLCHSNDFFLWCSGKQHHSWIVHYSIAVQDLSWHLSIVLLSQHACVTLPGVWEHGAAWSLIFVSLWKLLASQWIQRQGQDWKAWVVAPVWAVVSCFFIKTHSLFSPWPINQDRHLKRGQGMDRDIYRLICLASALFFSCSVYLPLCHSRSSRYYSNHRFCKV